MKRSNNILRFLYVLMLTVCFLAIVNVFFIAILKIHPRSMTSLKSYISNVSMVSITEHAKRGNIYSSDGVVVAQDTETYDVICYLSKTRIGVGNKPAYVEDPAKTADVLSKVLDGDYLDIYYNLTKNPNLYQTEIGRVGRNISIEKKEEIESYDLPGIGFRTSYQRSYTQGSSFAPYLLGFAQSNDDGKLVGKMGVEQYLNSELSGVDGAHIYQQDKNGYVLTGMYEETIPASNGYDIYTTIDTSIQDALEASFEELAQGHDDAWGAVVEIDTGKILAWGQDPSFDPNVLDFETYNNLGAQLPYEPGSVFKSFVYAAVMEEGNYVGTNTLNSEPFCYAAGAGNEPFRTYSSNNLGCIYNANKKSWGQIDLDHGLIYSSNVATSTLLADYIDSETYLNYIKKFGFFKEVDSDGVAEEIGYYNYTYPSEKLSLTFGQGSSVTMLQLLQAYTAIFGNGEMVKPYFIDKIVNSDSNQIIYQGKRTVVDRVISESTAKQMQDLLYRVVYDERGTAKIYKVDEVEIMAKTGTAQFAVNGSYDENKYINSVMLAFPAENPKYMIYYAYVYPYDYGNVYNTSAVTNLIRRVALYENVNYDSSNMISTKIEKIEMPNVLGKDVNEATVELNKLGLNVYKIGNGASIIKQYPNNLDDIYTNGKVFLLTETGNTVLPDFRGWTRKDIIAYWNISGLEFILDGSGVASSQSIPAGTLVDKNASITISFKQIDSYIDVSLPQPEEMIVTPDD